MLNKRILITGIGNSGIIHSILANARFLETRDPVYLVMDPPPEPEPKLDPMDAVKYFISMEPKRPLDELYFDDGREYPGLRRIRTVKERRKVSKRRKISKRSRKLNNRRRKQ